MKLLYEILILGKVGNCKDFKNIFARFLDRIIRKKRNLDFVFERIEEVIVVYSDGDQGASSSHDRRAE